MIAAERGTLAVQLVAQLFRFADRMVTMDADVGAVRVKAASQRRADAPGAAGDQHGAAGEGLALAAHGWNPGSWGPCSTCSLNCAPKQIRRGR